MRRLFAATVAAGLLVAGCGGGSSSSTTTPSSTSTTTPATTSSAKATTTTKTTKGLPSGTLKKLSKPAPPEAIVEAALTANPGGPRIACDLYSDALLKSAYGDKSGCEEAIKSGGSAKAVKVVSSKASGTSATVVAIPSGGPSSGEKLTYTLVMENGQWRLDKVDSNVKVGP